MTNDLRIAVDWTRDKCPCSHCGSAVMRRVWATSDRSYEDVERRCGSAFCRRTWWEDTIVTYTTRATA